MPAGTFAQSSSPALRSSASRRTTTCRDTWRRSGWACGSRFPRPRLLDRSPANALDDPRGHGVAGEARGVGDAALAHEILPMFFDGLDADAELGRGLLVRLPLGDQLKDLHLARGQADVPLRAPSLRTK